MLEFINMKHESLTASASLLYDFSEIALGALIASVTQVLKITENSKKTNEKEA